MQMLQPSITINLKPISHTVENFTRTSPTLPLTYTKVLQSSKFCVTIVSFVSPKKQGERHLWGASRLSQLLRGVVLRSIHIYRACSGIVHGSDMSKKVQQRSGTERKRSGTYRHRYFKTNHWRSQWQSSILTYSNDPCLTVDVSLLDRDRADWCNYTYIRSTYER